LICEITQLPLSHRYRPLSQHALVAVPVEAHELLPSVATAQIGVVQLTPRGCKAVLFRARLDGDPLRLQIRHRSGHATPDDFADPDAELT